MRRDCGDVPVYGDVLQQSVGQAVVQDDSPRGNFESNLLRLLSTSFSLLHRQERSVVSRLALPGIKSSAAPELKEKQRHPLAR